MTSFESLRKLVVAKLYPFSVDPGNYLGRAVELNGLLHLRQIEQCFYFFMLNLPICHEVKITIHLVKRKERKKERSEKPRERNILGYNVRWCGFGVEVKYPLFT